MRVRVFMLNGLQEPVLVAERESLEEALLIVMSLVAIEKKTVILEPVTVSLKEYHSLIIR